MFGPIGNKPARVGIVKTIFNDAIRTTDCPTCEAEAGTPCEDQETLHLARFVEYTQRVNVRERIERCGRKS